jgi:regulator of sirC expression with transglutaminase-like and TPR domain
VNTIGGGSPWAPYASRRDWLRALGCCDRILLVALDAASELRDRGLLYEQLECFGPARDDLERYLALVPGTPEGDALRARIEVIRLRAAHIH